MSSTPERSRRQFGLKSVLFLMLVVGVVGGMFVRRQLLYEERFRLRLQEIADLQPLSIEQRITTENIIRKLCFFDLADAHGLQTHYGPTSGATIDDVYWEFKSTLEHYIDHSAGTYSDRTLVVRLRVYSRISPEQTGPIRIEKTVKAPEYIDLVSRCVTELEAEYEKRGWDFQSIDTEAVANRIREDHALAN